MIGNFKVMHIKSKKVVLEVSYNRFEYAVERLNKLDRYLNDDNFKIICGCNKSLEMHIDSLGRIYTLKNGNLNKHHCLCPKNPDYNENIKKGWEYQRYNKIIADLDFSIFNNGKYKKRNSNKINIDEFSQKLHLYSTGNCEVTKDKFNLLNNTYRKSKYIQIKGLKDLTLRELYFNTNKPYKITENTPKFVYMYLNNFNIDKQSGLVNLHCQYTKDKFADFIVDKKLFNDKYFKIKEKHSFVHVLVSGFVRKTSKGVEFFELSLLRVDCYGFMY